MSDERLKRDIGPIGLIALAVSGIVGSGWLFAPMLTAQLAGPAAIVAWIIGASCMLLLALTFGEIAAMFPLPGGIASIPGVTHGNIVSITMGWTAWLGYMMTAPVEVEATLRYLTLYAPWLFQTSQSQYLSLPGAFFALGLMSVFVVLNAFGVKLFTLINTGVTWIKIAVPLVITAMFIASAFEPANFVQPGGFAPYGINGILAAVSSGGVVLSMIGFRHAIDMAGEVRNPGRSIPLAMILAMLICLLLYVGLQIAFIGAVPSDAIAGGWANLHLTHSGGPLASVATALGLLWLVSLMNSAAIISPFGSALVAVGANARLVMAMTGTRLIPAIFGKVSRFGVPLYALLLNLVMGWLTVLLLPFSEIVATHSSLVVFSFILGPVAVVALRKLAPDYPRPFKLPLVQIIGLATFILATLIIYWSGWNTIRVIGLALIAGALLFAVRIRHLPASDFQYRSAIWLLPYCAGIGLISWLGSFGGLNILTGGLDVAACVALGIVAFHVAVRSALSQTEFNSQAEEMLAQLGYEKDVLYNLDI
ncbi:MAG: APC family permease [Alphaproteobacteria bacterium]|nr:APC family permease [Alphaproteobacteria bacterium]